MPIYERCCLVCKGTKEIILRIDEREKEIICSSCHVVMVKMISMPAKTAGMWASDWRDGMSGAGFYSPSLGKTVGSAYHERKIMESKGFVAESDMAPGFIDRHIEKKAEDAAKADAISNTYINNLTRFNGDKIKAVSETFPVHEMLKEA
jgi:predicted nucleic acid-binding Zn ribbon protein